MNVNHLHLHVRDVERARRFYEQHFGLREHVRHGGILFMRDEAGMDLALAPDPDPAELPSWFHFGFRLGSAAEVRTLRTRLSDADVALDGELIDDPDLVAFRCRDPDGNRIEVYWE